MITGSSRPPRVLLYGGTFDPIHNGHVALLWQVQHQLRADAVRLIPCGQPALKAQPQVANQHRLAMLELAVAQLNRAWGQPVFAVDSQELQRTGVTYTLHTLEAARATWGEQAALVWLMGMDSWQQLDRWHAWQALPDKAHLAVVDRPGCSPWPQVQQLHWQGAKTRPLERLYDTPAGAVVYLPTTPLAIASSAIRHNLQQGLRPLGLVPCAVESYLQRTGLYSSLT